MLTENVTEIQSITKDAQGVLERLSKVVAKEAVGTLDASSIATIDDLQAAGVHLVQVLDYLNQARWPADRKTEQ